MSSQSSDMTLQDLEKEVSQRAEKEKLYQKNYARWKYQLCRQLGFSAMESRILKGKSRETIRRLAQEKGLV